MSYSEKLNINKPKTSTREKAKKYNPELAKIVHLKVLALSVSDLLAKKYPETCENGISKLIWIRFRDTQDYWWNIARKDLAVVVQNDIVIVVDYTIGLYSVLKL